MKSTTSVAIIALLALVSACAPSPEQVATMTAAAWTPTPPPTPTPTPIPYNLTVHVRDAAGTAIPGASIVIPESGSDKPQQTDEAGVAAWKMLPGPEANLNVSAPGYFPATQPVTMNPGDTEMVIILQNDPFGLVPANACAPDEKLLYSEDFQDGKAQGFANITGAVELNAQNGWAIVPEADGNQVARFSGIHENMDNLQGYTFDNVVWRIRVKTEGQDGFSFLDFKSAQAAGADTRYPIQWGASALMALTRLEMPGAGHLTVKTSGLRVKQDQWYYVEISYYQGAIQVWVDGKMLMSYTDPKPLPPGTIGLEGHIFKDANTAYYFDDLSVCGLSAPFSTTLYKAATP